MLPIYQCIEMINVLFECSVEINLLPSNRKIVTTEKDLDGLIRIEVSNGMKIDKRQIMSSYQSNQIAGISIGGTSRHYTFDCTIWVCVCWQHTRAHDINVEYSRFISCLQCVKNFNQYGSLHFISFHTKCSVVFYEIRDNIYYLICISTWNGYLNLVSYQDLSIIDTLVDC